MSARRRRPSRVRSVTGASSVAIPSAARGRTGPPQRGAAPSPGPRHATAGLFRGATWFLTPDTTTDPERYRTLHGFVASLGAVPIAVDPQAHDRLLALTSPLSH